MVDSRAEAGRELAGNHLPASGASMAYESPEAVQADETLSASQKRRFLEEWLETLTKHLGGAEVADADRDQETALAERIRRCLSDLPEG